MKSNIIILTARMMASQPSVQAISLVPPKKLILLNSDSCDLLQVKKILSLYLTKVISLPNFNQGLEMWIDK